jgi:biotin carboxyl carrier protein
MRRLLSATIAAGCLAAPAGAQAAGTGGVAGAGGALYTGASTPSSLLPTVPTLRVAPATATLATRLTFVVPATVGHGRVKARIDLVPLGMRRAIARVRLSVRLGRRSVVRWTPRAAQLPAGRYGARLTLSRRGVVARAALRVVAPAPAPAPTTTRPAAATPVATPAPAPPVTPPSAGRALATLSPGTFPVQGAFNFGGVDSRFGSGRTGHLHQGQDIAAASGTPVVAPLAGTVAKTAYQAVGAGYYVVLHGGDGRDYVFMHLLAGSTLVQAGQAVARGQRLALVGMTGGTSSGPHLHFEIWPGGWYASAGSQPVDPLPQLQAWAG